MSTTTDISDECIGCSHSLGSHAMRDGSCQYCNCPTFKGAPSVTAPFGWWESLNDWALYSDFPARGKKIAEIVLEAEEYRWRALDGEGGIFGAGGSATLEGAKANAERMCRARGTMPVKMGERVEEPQAPHPGPLTDLVLDALPANGTGLFLDGVIERLPAEHMASTFIDVPAAVRGALDELVRRGDVRRLDGCYARVVEPQAPPAWLTAAVLAALPADGTPLAATVVNGIPYSLMGECIASIPKGTQLTEAMVGRALSALVVAGEIEVSFDRDGLAAWRRWGVPEGWSDWTVDEDGASNIACLADPHIAARAYRDGEWKVWDGQSYSPQWQGRAKPGRLANAKRAALRTCHAMLAALASRQSSAPTLTTSTPQGAGMGEQVASAAATVASSAGASCSSVCRGAACIRDGIHSMHKGQRPDGAWEVWPNSPAEQEAKERAALAPAPTRAEQVRLALLAVLTRGAVEGRSHVLAALDAAPGGLGVSSVEALQAAREIGASVDGARWSVPAMPAGFQWLKSYSMGEVYYLGPIAYADMSKDKLATVESANGACAWQLVGAPAWSEADSLADGQAAALTAARLAGLFAPRPAAVAAAPVEPVAITSAQRELANPLRAAIQAIIDGEPGECVEGHLTAWGAALVAEARATRHTIEAVGEQDGMAARVTIDGPTLRVYANDRETMLHEERIGGDSEGTARAERDARIWQERAAEAKTHGDEARATLAQVMAERDAAERAAAEARLEAEAAERRAAQAERERDKARAELAALREGVDGLRTWAHGVKGASK